MEMVSEEAPVGAPREELVDGSRQVRKERGPNSRSRGRNSESMRTQQRGVCWKGVQGPAGSQEREGHECKVGRRRSHFRHQTLWSRHQTLRMG